MNYLSAFPIAKQPIRRADTLKNGIVVIFESGEERIYPADLLYAMQPVLRPKQDDGNEH